MSTKGMKMLTDALPGGWREKAKETKAIQREGDYIKKPDDLLRVILLWSEIQSYGSASAYLKMTGDFPLSKNAVRERVRGSVSWLEWIVTSFCREQEFLGEKPEWLKDRRVLIADATNVSKPGSTKADYRLHYMMDLFTLGTVEQHLTDGKIGESATNFETLKEGDLFLADRAYGTLKGLRWVREHGADCLFRMKANSFNLYEKTEDGEYRQYDLTGNLSHWKAGRVVDLSLWCRDGKEMLPIRICAFGKTQKEIDEGIRRIKQSNTGKNRTKVTPLQSIYNKYVVVMTTMAETISAQQILELYRMRWQVELVFKRMKSLLAYDKLQGTTEETVKAWFYCKLLIAALCEYFLNKASFSPVDEAGRNRGAALVLEGISACLTCDNLAQSFLV